MVMANTACGVFMAAVHPIASAMPAEEYGGFYSLLRVFTLLSIPAAGLQTIFVQQAAAAVTEVRRRELAGTTRTILWSIGVFWLVLAGITFLLQDRLVATLQLKNAAALWITMLVALAALWLPILQGLLQGAQKFLWLGWSMIGNGIGRFTAILVIVWWLHGWAAGAMTGALLGFVSALGVSAWQCRELLRTPGLPFQWRPWLRRVVPLSFGVAASLFVMNADMVIVRSYFPTDVTAFYAAGAMIGVALVTFTTPLAAVMFPKIVRSVARAEKSNALPLALGATALLGSLGALVCTLFPELVLRMLFPWKPEFLRAAPLVPWFMWCLVPVTLANVLIGNLLARERFAVVPWLTVIALGYGIAQLAYVRSALQVEPFQAFRTVVQILGLFSLLLLAAAAFFTWRTEPQKS